MRRDVFQAISDPTRREIINLLARDSLNLNAVAEKFKISRPAISKHIKILTQCGLVIIRAEGRERYCEAQLHQLKQVSEWTDQYKVFWENKLSALERHLSAGNRTKNKNNNKK
ncbi:MAG: metalloregulator ArsR/SmtB family transcription factor [Prolixibacteraceae bacterium]